MVSRISLLCFVFMIAGLVSHAVPARAEQTIAYGTMVHQTKVEGYSLHYHLLIWQERNILMKDMGGMDMPGVDRSGKATHHLLLYLQGTDGRGVPAAKVGFRIAAPDGSIQTTLTMAMQGGYGADVVLPTNGIYVIVMKADLGGNALADEFTLGLK